MNAPAYFSGTTTPPFPAVSAERNLIKNCRDLSSGCQGYLDTIIICHNSLGFTLWCQNHAKVLSIFKQTKYASYKETFEISPREWRRLKVGEQSVGFYLWTATQNHKLPLFSRHTFLVESKIKLSVWDFMSISHHLRAQKRAPSKPKHPLFSSLSGKHSTHNNNSEALHMLQVFLSVLTAKVRRRVMECVQLKTMTKLFIGWSYQQSPFVYIVYKWTQCCQS